VEVWKAILSAAAQAEGFGKPADEFVFHDRRKWRFDLAWPDVKVAFEKEGMAYVKPGSKSRHTTRDGYAGDCCKYNTAQIAGWVVIRATARQIESGVAADFLLAALRLRTEGQGT
jgi:hypothetical protein